MQGCYVDEYHEWEKAIKHYFKAQRALNGLGGDFDWRSGSKSMVQRANEVLAFFSASVDERVLAIIDRVRETVNRMKHDPLSVRVSGTDYYSAVKAFEQFWEQLMNFEGRAFAQ